MSAKRFDVLILLWLVVIGVLYAIAFRDSVFGRALISFGVFSIPSILYMGWRKKKNWKKIFVSALVFGALFGFMFDFVAEYTKAYSIVSTVFPFRLYGILPIDNILGHMLMTALTVTFYEHFIDREKHKAVSKNLKYAVLPAIAVSTAILILFFLRPESLATHYPYFYMGLAAIAPPIYLAIKKPHFIKNMAETAVYFFFLYFIVELVAVSLGYWIYNGNNYIGWITIFHLTFPFEELFFWMLFYAACIVSYYELFIDDH